MSPKASFIVGALLATAALLSLGQSRVMTQDIGRFQLHASSDNQVWVIDTTTGAVKWVPAHQAPNSTRFTGVAFDQLP